jgi:hypothetical protein
LPPFSGAGFRRALPFGQAHIEEETMGLDDMLKQQIGERLHDLKPRLVEEFNELTHRDVEEAGDDPDAIVDKIQQKTGQPREQVEERVRRVVHR